MGSRGSYRGIYTAMIDDPDYQRLTANDRLVLLTARLCSQASIAAIFRYYPGVLMAQTGLTSAELTKAIAQLHAARWIDHEYPVLWIRNGLRFDPSIRLADEKHRKAVEKQVAGLPRLAVVLRFCDYYDLPRPFEAPSEVLSSPIVGLGIGISTSSRSRRGSGGNNGRSVEAGEIIDWLNVKAGTSFRQVAANLNLIHDRLEDGIALWQLKAIVSRKVREWGPDPKMSKYVRPSTLFNKVKCEQYLGELPPEEPINGHGMS